MCRSTLSIHRRRKKRAAGFVLSVGAPITPFFRLPSKDGAAVYPPVRNPLEKNWPIKPRGEFSIRPSLQVRPFVKGVFLCSFCTPLSYLEPKPTKIYIQTKATHTKAKVTFRDRFGATLVLSPLTCFHRAGRDTCKYVCSTLHEQTNQRSTRKAKTRLHKVGIQEKLTRGKAMYLLFDPVEFGRGGVSLNQKFE